MEKQSEKVKETVIIDAEWLATEVAGIIYSQGKAQVMNIIESQLSEEVFSAGGQRRYSAIKRLAETCVESIARKAAVIIRDVLGDWKQEVESGPDMITPEQLRETRKWYKDAERIAR